MPRLLKLAVVLLSLSLSLCAQSGTPPAPKPTYVLEPITISNAVYPAPAREQKIQGVVTVFILVSETGSVENVDVWKADALLSQAAGEAVKKWTFKPVVVDGRALAVTSKVIFNFVADKDGRFSEEVAPEIAPATQFPKSVKVSQKVAQGLVLSAPPPDYPPEASAHHIQGTVRVGLTIGTDGIPHDLRVVSGNFFLAQAAIDAVKQWRYKPYFISGRAVEIEALLDVNFALAAH